MKDVTLCILGGITLEKKRILTQRNLEQKCFSNEYTKQKYFPRTNQLLQLPTYTHFLSKCSYTSIIVPY